MARAAPLLPVLTLTDTRLIMVKPLEKTAHVETIDATFMDLIKMDNFVPVIFAYRSADKSETAYLRLLNDMKESLQKVLMPFFGFAGRWIATPEGSRRLLCNDEGVPFIEAYVNKDLDSIMDASAAFQPVPELNGYGVLGMDTTQYRQRMQPDGGLPCIIVQITRFKCGGVVLGVTFNHTHTDAQGFFNFMQAWSDLSRSNETAVKVDHNRALAEISSFSKFVLDLNDSIAATIDKVGSPNPELWVLKTFEVGGATINALKQEVKDGGYGYVSTVDCIVAHLRKGLSRLHPSVLGDREISVATPVEGRNKFYDPPQPHLCGNVLAGLIAPKIPTKELQEMPLVSLAIKQREKLLATKREEWLGLKSFEELMSACDLSKSALVIVTSWLKFPMYEIDFGPGKPFFAFTANILSSTDSFALTRIGPPIPSSSSSVATVCLSSPPAVLEALERDPDFLPFFLPHPNEKFKNSL